MSRMYVTMPEEIIQQIKEIAKNEFRRPGQQALHMIQQQLAFLETVETKIPGGMPENWQFLVFKQNGNED
ncbi:MAG: hypothetical protein FVQ82_17000 [Planctomycetes bacterium]|nr:hypothetical protein [Planctomycetota bacterium]